MQVEEQKMKEEEFSKEEQGQKTDANKKAEPPHLIFTSLRSLYLDVLLAHAKSRKAKFARCVGKVVGDRPLLRPGLFVVVSVIVPTIELASCVDGNDLPMAWRLQYHLLPRGLRLGSRRWC